MTGIPGDRRWTSGFLFLLAALAAGCGDGKVPVSGSIRFDGTDVEEGYIAFEPADGQGPTAGGSIEYGRYELTGEAGVLPGKKVVRIKAVRTTGQQVQANKGMPGPALMVEETEQYIPTCYNDASILTREVLPRQENALDFDLRPVKPANAEQDAAGPRNK